MSRAGMDISSLFSGAPMLSLAQRGDGHPVLVIPGFLADDNSTWVLRQYLKRLGYQAQPWEQQRNLGVTAMGGYESLVQHVLRLHRETGQRVSIVGWSLGGVHALAVAHRAEYAVRQVITMGSPIVPSTRQSESAPRMDQVGVNWSSSWRNNLLKITNNLPISSIYSRSDGVVPWRRSQIPTGPNRENIEVLSSHMGLGFNATVLLAIADRLALPKGEFKPFNPQGLGNLLYPNPNRFRFN